MKNELSTTLTFLSPATTIAKWILLEVWLSREQAAELLVISLSALDRLIATGQLPVLRIGRRVVITTLELDRFVDRNLQTLGAQ